MIICPVCEHHQAQGDECDNCGKKLQAPRPVAVAVAVLPELEQTQLAGGRVPVPVDVVPELEVTRLKAGPDLPPQVVQDLDPTRMDAKALPDMPILPLDELDTGRAEDDGVRTMAFGPVVCPNCSHVQFEESLDCGQCGLRLPRIRQDETPRQPGRAAGEQPWVDCPRCRTPNRPGAVCATCGNRLAAEA